MSEDEGKQPEAQPAAPVQAKPPQGSAGPDSADEVLYEGAVAHSALLPRYLGWVLASVVGGILAWVLRPALADTGLAGYQVLLVLVGLPGLVWTYLVVVTTRFKIDRRRIEMERGVISKEVDSLELWRVVDVRYQQSLLDRLTGNGRIITIGTDKSHPELHIHGLPTHRQLFEQLRDAVQMARHTNRPLELVDGEGMENLAEMQ